MHCGGTHADQVRTRCVFQNYERVAADLVGDGRGASRSAGANGGARRIRVPPVVRRGNGRTGYRNLVNEIVGQVACEAAEANGRGVTGCAYKDASARISRDYNLG